MAPAAINDLFSRFGLHAKAKLVVLGAPADWRESFDNRFRSLNLEHVSPAVMRPEISRRRAPGAAEENALAPLRRWFFARKPDAGFVLADFPATLLQAKVFDEWLEVRSEMLDAVVAAGPADPSVIGHYRSHGFDLLLEGIR